MNPTEVVIYVPTHAKGDMFHKDVELGIIKSLNDKSAFVNYYLRGILQETAQSTTLTDLVKFPFKEGDEVNYYWLSDKLKTGKITKILDTSITIDYSETVHFTAVRLTRDTKIVKILGYDIT